MSVALHHRIRRGEEVVQSTMYRILLSQLGMTLAFLACLAGCLLVLTRAAW